MKQISKLDILTVYALRTDDDKIPVIEIVQLFEDKDDYNRLIYRALHKVESENELYPYDYLKNRQWIRPSCISDCHSKGYIFYTMHDAIKRLETVVSKREAKAEQEWSTIADWKVRLDYIRMQNAENKKALQ